MAGKKTGKRPIERSIAMDCGLHLPTKNHHEMIATTARGVGIQVSVKGLGAMWTDTTTDTTTGTMTDTTIVVMTNAPRIMQRRDRHIRGGQVRDIDA